MDKHRVVGALHEMKGAAKQTIGNAIGSRTLIDEGKAERIAGGIQRTLGVTNESLRNAIRKL